MHALELAFAILAATAGALLPALAWRARARRGRATRAEPGEPTPVFFRRYVPEDGDRGARPAATPRT